MTDIIGSTVLPKIEEKKENTPKTIEAAQKSTPRILMALLATPILSGIQPSYAKLDETALLYADQEYSVVSEEQLGSEAGAHQISDAEKENQTRLELLARNYASKTLNAEEEARLAIATNRVRKLIPRVTSDDFDALAEILERVNSIVEQDKETRLRFSLDDASKPTKSF